MNKIRCVVVDDEAVARQGLVQMLRNFPMLEVVGEAHNAETMQKLLGEVHPELLFLDIMLRNENVLDFLPVQAARPVVIFTTAYPQHALRSYDIGAADYLLKPIVPGLLERAIQRAYKIYLNNHQTSEDIYLRINGKYHRIFYRDILFLEGMENYVVVQTTSKKLVCKSTMQWFENTLPAEKFLRVHRSYIVNKERVDMIDKLHIVIGEFLIPISRENKHRIYSALIPDFKA